MNTAIDLQAFHESLARPHPPQGMSRALQALWWDANGDWEKAHECAQAEDGGDGAWVHAYLHRKEGDHANARYWYRRAGRTPATSSLDEEWRAIAAALLPSA
jgi:hypothetical protein